MANSKVIILDGIGGVPMGREIHQAFGELNIDCMHYDLAELEQIRFYRLRAVYSKTINKHREKDSFYYLPRVQERVLEHIVQQQRPSHLLVIGFIYKFIRPAFIRHLADKYGCALFLFDTDSCNLYTKRREFLYFLEQELPAYDRILSFSKVTTGFFAETRGLNASYFPFGAHPIKLPDISQAAHEVLFVGSGDLRRILLLEHIKERVHVYGNRWQRNFPLMSKQLQQRVVDKPVWGEALHQLFADADIILNITRAPFYAAETGINLRIFEALAAGKFLLTDYCDEVVEMFEPGVEIETFKSSRELIEKVGYYLAHPEQRVRIAQAGHKKFLERYTWSARTKVMAVEMGIVV